MHFLRTFYLDSHRPNRLASRGFTAIELMVVVGVIAILTALAAPSFSPMIDRWRVRQVIEGMKSTLYYARSEAIKRGGNIFIDKINFGTDGCQPQQTQTNVDWDCGWEVYIVQNNSNTNHKEVLQHFSVPANVAIKRSSPSSSANATGAIEINRWGQVNSSGPAEFTVRPASTTSSPATRSLCMSLGGRIKVINGDSCSP